MEVYAIKQKVFVFEHFLFAPAGKALPVKHLVNGMVVEKNDTVIYTGDIKYKSQLVICQEIKH